MSNGDLQFTTTPDGFAANETAAGVLAGVELAGPQPVGDSDRFFTQLLPVGAKVETFDLEQLEEKLAPYPRRKKGTVHVHDAGSFVDYFLKHCLESSEVFADGARMALVGVVNAHEQSDSGGLLENTAGHGDHRVELELIQSPEWKAWTALDKKAMTQQKFAEHIEDNAADVTHPDSATMLEIAESFHATLGADFKRSERLATGVVQLRYEETQTAKAGHTGDLDIPTEFTLALAPFVGAPLVDVTARFRYRINAGDLTLSYALVRPELVALDAFRDHVAEVREAVPNPVFLGRPA